MLTDYNDFLEAFEEFYGTNPNVSPEPTEVKKTLKRKDYCHDCKDEGEWVMMALKCTKCEKVLIG